MKNYSEMSDFEINCEVLVVIEPDVAHMQLSADQKSFYHCGYDGNGFYETAIPDYCNSWADAGPIIEKYRMTIMPASQGENWMAQAFDYAIADISIKPLRSAMIVFLMIKDKK